MPEFSLQNWPRYEDNRPIHIVKVDEEMFVDWKRSRPHACLYYEYGMVEHLRCKICGHVLIRTEWTGGETP